MIGEILRDHAVQGRLASLLKISVFFLSKVLSSFLPALKVFTSLFIYLFYTTEKCCNVFTLKAFAFDRDCIIETRKLSYAEPKQF